MLTHWGIKEMANIMQTIFSWQKNFVLWSNFTQVCPQGSNRQWGNIDIRHVLVPNYFFHDLPGFMMMWWNGNTFCIFGPWWGESTSHYPDSKVHGANMGPTWVLSAPDWPHVGPMNLAIWVVNFPQKRASNIEHWSFFYVSFIEQAFVQAAEVPWPSCRWLSARLQYLQSVSNGDTAVLY